MPDEAVAYRLSVTIPKGQLPIQPRITPGWAVSGAILILTGIVCGMVGIKKKWLHTFLTTGFLVSLGTTVLILYVTDPPVSDAVQGAYVVAAVCTGLIVGGLAIIFQDLAQSSACLLAGFCFSMWLLTLGPGGLIHHKGGKVAFIVLLSLAWFCLYFTRWTRTYSLTAAISFSGATAAVLGIDCFSRAGMKEFWAYIWDLNGDIFPLGTVTYPLTRGICAEIAAIMVIFVAWIVSQLEPWCLVRNRGESKPADHERNPEAERNLEAEDEKTACQLEEARARDLREWERKYGDGEIRQVSSAEDSDLGHTDSENGMLRHSQRIIPAATASRSRSTTGMDSNISNLGYAAGAMTPLSPAQATAAAMACFPTRNLNGASDDTVPSECRTDTGSPTSDEENTDIRVNDGRKVVSSVMPASRPRPQSSSDTYPSAKPLSLERIERQDGIGGLHVPVEDDGGDWLGQTEQRRSTTMTRRLSNRNLSPKPVHREAERSQQTGDSREGGVAAIWRIRNDTDSVAVNLDDLGSVSNDESIEDDQMDEGKVSSFKTQSTEDTSKQTEASVKPTEEISDKLLSEGHSDQPDHSQVQQGSDIPSTSRGYGLMFDEPYEFQGEKEKPQPSPVDAPGLMGGSEMRSSGSPKLDESSGSGPLEENLAQELSPIALYHRTKEWAKHLDAADTPEEPVAPQPIDDSKETNSDLPTEKPVPVDLSGLQQTATNASLPRAIPRTKSLVTDYLARQRAIHRSSSGSVLQRYPEDTYHASDSTPEPGHVATTRAFPYRSASESFKGLTSRLYNETITEEGGAQSHQRASPQLSGVEHKTSRSVSLGVSGLAQTPRTSQHQTPSTMMDTRKEVLRSKSQGHSFNAPAVEVLHDRAPAVKLHLVQDGSDSPPIDTDDIPLSQRRKIIRESSLTSESRNRRSRDRLQDPTNPKSSPKLNNLSLGPSTPDAVREAKLANFRDSVAADLRASLIRNASTKNNITTARITSSTSPLQPPATVYDPHSVGHQFSVITQTQTQEQIHSGLGRRALTQRNTYGYGKKPQQQQQDPRSTGVAVETLERHSSGQTQLQVARAHRAHRAHRDAMRRLQASTKTE